MNRFYSIGFLLVLSTMAVAEVDLASVRAQLDNVNQAIAINEGGLKSIDAGVQSITDRIKKECGVDLNSKKSSTNRCSMENYTALIQQFSQLKTAQDKVGDQLAKAKQSYKKILKDSKSQLTAADYASLLETSGDLNDAETRRMKVNAKADVLRMELNQAKATIEQTDQYKLLSKALTNTLNSSLFCQARDRCDEKAGNVYEGDVAAKILSNATTSLAKSKQAEKTGSTK